MFRLLAVVATFTIIASATPLAEADCIIRCPEVITTCAPGVTPPVNGCACPCVPGITARATPPSCSTPTTTVHTSLHSPTTQCDLICIQGGTICSPGQLPTPPPGVATTTSGCTVSIITSATPACGPCPTCILV